MNVFYREPEQIAAAVDHINGVELIERFPTAEDVRTATLRPFMAGYMKLPLSTLVDKAFESHVRNFECKKRRSGIRYPETLEVNRRFDCRKITVEEVGILGVRFFNNREVQVYALNRVPEQDVASLIGIVDMNGEGDSGFQSVSMLHPDLSRELSRYALGQYRLRSTFDEFHD